MSQIATRSRGQVRKANQNVSALRLRKKVAPKLVSTRPKRTPSSPKKKEGDTPSCTTSSEQGGEVVNTTQESGDLVGTTHHEECSSKIFQTNSSNVENASLPGNGTAQSTLDLNFDLQTRATNVDDFYAHEETVTDVTTNDTIEVHTSENTIGSELLDFTDGSSGGPLPELTQVEINTQEEQPPSQNSPPYLQVNAKDDNADNIRTSGETSDVISTGNDDVTDISVVSAEEQSSPKEKKRSKTIKKVS